MIRLSLLTLAAAEVDLVNSFGAAAANATDRALKAYLQLRFGAISTALPAKGGLLKQRRAAWRRPSLGPLPGVE